MGSSGVLMAFGKDKYEKLKYKNMHYDEFFRDFKLFLAKPISYIIQHVRKR